MIAIIRFATEIIPIIPYIGIVFSFTGFIILDRYHFRFLMILKETLTFLSLSNPVHQYCIRVTVYLKRTAIFKKLIFFTFSAHHIFRRCAAHRRSCKIEVFTHCVYF